MNHIYQTLLLDHYRFPRNYGLLEAPNVAGVQYNPSCGDHVSINGLIEGDRVIQLGYQARGCVISVAAASLLSEVAQKQNVETIKSWDAAFMLDLLGISLGPTRLKCALLPLIALQEMVGDYKKN